MQAIASLYKTPRRLAYDGTERYSRGLGSKTPNPEQRKSVRRVRTLRSGYVTPDPKVVEREELDEVGVELVERNNHVSNFHVTLGLSSTIAMRSTFALANSLP